MFCKQVVRFISTNHQSFAVKAKFACRTWIISFTATIFVFWKNYNSIFTRFKFFIGTFSPISTLSVIFATGRNVYSVRTISFTTASLASLAIDTTSLNSIITRRTVFIFSDTFASSATPSTTTFSFFAFFSVSSFYFIYYTNWWTTQTHSKEIKSKIEGFPFLTYLTLPNYLFDPILCKKI